MGYIFAILSYALYATVNYVDKFVLEKYKINPVVLTIYTGISALIATCIILLFTGFHSIDFSTGSIIVISGILTQLYLIPYFKALRLDEASRVIPLFQLSPIVVLFLGFLFLGEIFSFKQYIGAALIIGASLLLTIEKLDLKIIKLRPALYYAMLSCTLYGFAIFLFKIGLTQDISFWIALPYEGLGIVIGSVCILFYKNNFSQFIKITKIMNKKIFIYTSFNDLVFIASRYTQYFALTLLSASIVSLLGGFQPIFALLYGLLLSLWFPKIIKEIISPKNISIKIAAILIVCIGLYLLFI
ncbi:MAG TPA: EamA family transporter [Candidatus Saccharimonadales bacterium]|nr:EamA family transporter [Candidatus Saccharimonadales bacterium]